MVSRIALVVYILEAAKVMWLYEQPHSSLLFQHPRMQQLLKNMAVFRSHIYMGSYGALSPKPTFLWAPTPQVFRFSLPLPDKEWEEVVTKSVKEDGSVQVTGNSKLKASQTYPKEFGYATLRVWKVGGYRPFPKQCGPPKMPKNVWDPKDAWKDADLTEVFQFLSLGSFSK